MPKQTNITAKAEARQIITIQFEPLVTWLGVGVKENGY